MKPPRPPLDGRPLKFRKLRAQSEESQQLFARIVAADFACPRCDWVTRLTTSTGGARGVGVHKTSRAKNPTWQPRLGRFTCARCRLVLYLGIVAWPCVPNSGGKVPPDTLPTYRQALCLRRELSRLARRKRRTREGVNALGSAPGGAQEAEGASQEQAEEPNAWIWRRQRERAKQILEDEEAREAWEAEAWRRATEEEPGEEPGPGSSTPPAT